MKTFQISFFTLLLFFCAFSSQPIQAEMAAAQNINALNNCPTARFYVANNNQPAGTAIQFVNESIDGFTYLWDFGDGHTCTAINTSHVYNTAGTYTVTLTVIGSGCTVSFIGTDDIVVF